MRVFAVDYGEARTGVAVSDMTRTLVGDAWVLQNRNMHETARMIAEEAKSRDVSCIVIGYPKNMDGSIGESAKKSECLVDVLKPMCNSPPPSAQEGDCVHRGAPESAQQIEIVLWDERLTTKSAHRILTDAGKHGKKRKQTVDAVAASLILESYLASLQT